MYTGKLTLTNKQRTPLALTNDFDNTFEMVDAIKKCKNPRELLSAVVKHSLSYGWALDNDCAENTRLTHTDPLGNVHFLIAYKEKKEVSNDAQKTKILEVCDALEVFTAGRPLGENVQITVEELQKHINTLYKVAANIK